MATGDAPRCNAWRETCLLRVWEYVIWALIFRELVDEDAAIAAACVVRDRDSAANIVLRILKHLLSKYLNDD